MLIVSVSFEKCWNNERLDSPTLQAIRDNNSTKKYNYFTDDATIVIGDKVVVDSPYGGYVVVDVLDTRDKLYDDRASKWVVCKVDDRAYRARLEASKRRAAILKVLESKAKRVEESQKFRYLASVDQDAAALLTELDELEGRAPSITAQVVPDEPRETVTPFSIYGDRDGSEGPPLPDDEPEDNPDGLARAARRRPRAQTSTD
jgi:hypothetical protein